MQFYGQLKPILPKERPQKKTGTANKQALLSNACGRIFLTQICVCLQISILTYCEVS